MTYSELVERAKKETSIRINNGEYRTTNGRVEYVACSTWEKGDQINLWTYWQGYQLKDVDKKGVDILLVGQDWGNPERNPDVRKRIEEIQAGKAGAFYLSDASPTDLRMKDLFEILGCNISKIDPGKRLFFTNYSLGYRSGPETGGMTKALMRMDRKLFDDLVKTINPKLIICLGRLTFEMVSGTVADGFLNTLKKGIPLVATYVNDSKIPVYGVAHCGARGTSNVGGMDNMSKAWRVIARKENM